MTESIQSPQRRVQDHGAWLAGPLSLGAKQEQGDAHRAAWRGLRFLECRQWSMWCDSCRTYNRGSFSRGEDLRCDRKLQYAVESEFLSVRLVRFVRCDVVFCSG